jgi:hypothetical protein
VFKFKEADCRSVEARVFRFRTLDHRTQRLQHRREVGPKLHDGLPELSNFGAFVGEEKPEQPFQPIRVIDRTTHYLPAVLDQYRFARILEDDVVLRVTTAEFLLDLLVEIVVFVLCLPIPEGDTQFVQQRPVDEAAILDSRIEPVFGNKDKEKLSRPILPSAPH